MIFIANEPPIKVMVSKNEQRIKKQLLVLRKFLEIEGDKPIEVINQATMLQEQKSFGKKVVEVMRRMKKPVITANGPIEETKKYSREKDNKTYQLIKTKTE